MQELKEILNNLKLCDNDKDYVLDVIKRQISIHQFCNKDMNDIMLYIVGKKVEGIDYIKVFNKNTVVVEYLDTSYTRMRNLITLEDWNTNFILKVTFPHGSIHVENCKLMDISHIVYKKVKALTYGVTDGQNIAKIEVSQNDVKGVEYKALKDIVSYSFYHKLKGKVPPKGNNLTYVVLEYA